MTTTEVEALVLDARDRVTTVIRALKRYREMTDADLSVRMGMARGRVSPYVRGVAKIDVGVLAAFAHALGVTSEVLLMEPDEALLWTLQNAPNTGPGLRRLVALGAADEGRDLVEQSSPCIIELGRWAA